MYDFFGNKIKMGDYVIRPYKNAYKVYRIHRAKKDRLYAETLKVYDRKNQNAIKSIVYQIPGEITECRKGIGKRAPSPGNLYISGIKTVLKNTHRLILAKIPQELEDTFEYLFDNIGKDMDEERKKKYLIDLIRGKELFYFNNYEPKFYKGKT